MRRAVLFKLTSLALLCLITLSACGYKGGLYLPDENKRKVRESRLIETLENRN